MPTKELFSIVVSNNGLKQNPQISCLLGNKHKYFTNNLWGEGREEKVCEAAVKVMVQQESRWESYMAADWWTKLLLLRAI